MHIAWRQYFSYFDWPISWDQVWNFPLETSCGCSKILDLGIRIRDAQCVVQSNYWWVSSPALKMALLCSLGVYELNSCSNHVEWALWLSSSADRGTEAEAHLSGEVHHLEVAAWLEAKPLLPPQHRPWTRRDLEVIWYRRCTFKSLCAENLKEWSSFMSKS